MENLKKSLTWILVIVFLSYFGMENCCKVDTKTPLVSISGEDSLDFFGDPVYIETSDWNFNQNISFSSIDSVMYENEWGGDSLDIFGDPVYVLVNRNEYYFNKKISFSFIDSLVVENEWGGDSLDVFGHPVYYIKTSDWNFNKTFHFSEEVDTVDTSEEYNKKR